MATFSLCMIVKNEEKVLARCLDSIADLMDEIIIVDTGSTDKTKEIASRYTDKIYSFNWDDDFSDARNFSFEQASMEYIYVADADEYLDEENRRQLQILKDVIDPQIDIVQMMYNTITNNTVLNIQKEYRPKLFRRLRKFTWIDPIHETVRLNPLVFDSDIVITHAPVANHGKRDFTIFRKAISKYGDLSEKVFVMYATELLKVGDAEDVALAYEYFVEKYKNETDQYLAQVELCVIVRHHRLTHDAEFITKLAHNLASETHISEVCYDIGLFYMDENDYDSALFWLKQAVNDYEPVVDIQVAGILSLEKICQCIELLTKEFSEPEKSKQLTKDYMIYKTKLEEWKLPVEEQA